MKGHKLARGLGWFSLALGAAELLAPSKLCRALGVPDRKGLVRSYGAREVASGVGILALGRRRAPWVWSRVAGDALDLTTLGAAWRRSSRRPAIAAAIASWAAMLLRCPEAQTKRTLSRGSSAFTPVRRRVSETCLAAGDMP